MSIRRLCWKHGHDWVPYDQLPDNLDDDGYAYRCRRCGAWDS
jgi:hypothetical protein